MTRICLVFSCVVAAVLADSPPSSNYGVPNYQTGGNNYQNNYQSGYQYTQPSGGCNRLTGQGCGGPIQTLPAPLPGPGPCGFNGLGCGTRPVGPIGGCNPATGQGCGISTGPIQVGGGTTVTKHVYVHVPPPEPEEVRQSVVQQQGITAQKHYKIIFIKTPSLSAQQQQIIRQQQQQQEEKTLIYVLSKRPDEVQQQVIDQQQRPSVINKPEVYFIKYKTQAQQTGGVDLNQNFNTGNTVNTVNTGSTGVNLGIDSSSTSVSTSGTGNLGYNANAQPY